MIIVCITRTLPHCRLPFQHPTLSYCIGLNYLRVIVEQVSPVA